MNKILKFLQKEWILILILIILAGVTRFLYLGHPKEVVFDEVYFTKWVTNYFKGDFYFDIHPPLAKMMLAASAKVFGYTDLGNANFITQIGDEYTTNFYKFLRGMEAFFGVVLILSVYALGKRMFKNKWPGFLAALLVIFDNAILVQSRFIFTDVFLLAFGVIGLYFIYRLKEHKKLNGDAWLDLFFAALFLTASVLVKWTALVFLGAGIFVLFLNHCLGKAGKIKLFIKEITLIMLIFVIVYFGVFAVHLLSLPNTGGPNADAFLSARSQSALLGNQYYGKYQPPSLTYRIIELNLIMFKANAGLNANHPYSSKWYSWPIMFRPIFDWNKINDNGSNSKIYLIGNPLIWWLGFLAVIFAFLFLFYELRFKEKTIYFQPLLVLCFGYLLNLLPYLIITRPAFLYHYFPSFIFMSLITGFLLWIFLEQKPLIIIFIFVVLVSAFIYFAPLSYGLPMTDVEYNARVWLPSWR